jgi:hypothetical protein
VSALHPVVNPVDGTGWGERRLSFGFFRHPGFNTLAECPPTYLDDGEAPKGASVLAGGYMRRKIITVRHIDAEAAA